MFKNTQYLLKKTIKHYLSTSYPTFMTKRLFKKKLNLELNIHTPRTFNEKLQWLKLNYYNNNPLVTTCADKYAVRNYITDLGHSEILNSIHHVWDNVEDIIWETLPNKFVLKCNHGAGYNIICRNKEELNQHKIRESLKKWMKEEYWVNTLELCYKNIPKKIICEDLIKTNDGSLPYDYKVFCFHGKPEFVMVCIERETKNPKFYFLDKNWDLLPYGLDYDKLPNNKMIKKPSGYEKLFYYAEELSKPFPFVRADFYLNNGNIIFGELTFVPAAGLDDELNNDNEKNVDDIIGALIDIEKIKNEQ
ncbi:Glycosyltransferase [Xenorhabdus bovienii str. feltiae Moldova]|uniref:Glycosyltransferase n=2 Tax=Xenorhabdus bovienii TaxID=40576 RepID=A0A077NFE9_XENBV|nr:Glycosyltransferase [Xenorhabdus bovienii str. feltiae Moldova]